MEGGSDRLPIRLRDNQVALSRAPQTVPQLVLAIGTPVVAFNQPGAVPSFQPLDR